jgi:hypothetical protein
MPPTIGTAGKSGSFVVPGRRKYEKPPTGGK